eukprot:scpid107998/ scgid5080/ 
MCTQDYGNEPAYQPSLFSVSAHTLHAAYFKQGCEYLHAYFKQGCGYRDVDISNHALDSDVFKQRGKLEHGAVKLEHGAVKLEHGAVKLEHGAVKLEHGAVKLEHGGVKHCVSL